MSLEVDARRHRAALTEVVFIAVTGSCGKTTTKNLIAGVLSGRYCGRGSAGSFNCGADLARELLTVRQDDEFFVQELAAWGPGTMEHGLELVRPQVGVVTNLRNDHYSAFHGPRGAQREKGKLVRRLPTSGTAVLNWDDPLVRELADQTSAGIVRVGRHRDADLRAEQVVARWPERLSFELVDGRQRLAVRTRLLGEHVLGSVLAAVAVGRLFDVPLTEAVEAVEAVEATPRRMSAVQHPDGVTFIRDDFKAPADSVPEVLRFLAEATADRKLVVFGRLSDYPGRSRPTYEQVARSALAVCDAVIFVGDRAAALWGRVEEPVDQLRLRAELGLPTGAADPPIFVFETVRRAGEVLADKLRAGDLVLLKGSGPADHLERIILRRERTVRCWMPRCGRVVSCDECSLLTVDC